MKSRPTSAPPFCPVVGPCVTLRSGLEFTVIDYLARPLNSSIDGLTAFWRDAAETDRTCATGAPYYRFARHKPFTATFREAAE